MIFSKDERGQSVELVVELPATERTLHEHSHDLTQGMQNLNLKQILDNSNKVKQIVEFIIDKDRSRPEKASMGSSPKEKQNVRNIEQYWN